MAKNLKLVAEFKILGLPLMTNAQKNAHWTKRHKESVKWKSLVGFECHKAGILQLGLTSAALTLTRHSSREPDFDGLVSGFKHVIDGLTDCQVIVDDKFSVIGQSTYLWVYSATKARGFVTVKIERPV